MTTLIGNCHVSPAATAPKTEYTLPLTFFDIVWINFQPVRSLFFYKFTGSKVDFVNSTVPQLKRSLSLTLNHYLPLAGNLHYPINLQGNKPLIKYVNGDYVSLTVAESMKDFDHLTDYCARDADEFYDFVPKLPPVIEEENGYKIVPVLALQVTVFPGCGICVGFSSIHSIGDASSIVRFINAWSSINKFDGDGDGDQEFLNLKGELLPLYDRTVIKDPLGLDTIYWKWNVLNNISYKSETFKIPTKRVRATFVLQEADIKKLKQTVLSKNPGLGFVSSFAASTAYAWTSLLKSVEEVERDELFVFMSDIRARVDPPVPHNYFGNCLGCGIVRIPRNVLVGDEGLVRAATDISEVIKNRLNNKDEVLKGAENWMADAHEHPVGISILAVNGSPKFDVYGVDFGWGRAKKVEVVSIDAEKYSMSLWKSRDFEGGLEIGFSLPRERMDKFSHIFLEGLHFHDYS